MISRFSGWVGEWRVDVLNESLPGWVNHMVGSAWVAVTSLDSMTDTLSLAALTNSLVRADVFNHGAPGSGRGILYPVGSHEDARHNVRRCLYVLKAEGARLTIKIDDVIGPAQEPVKILRLLVEMYEFYYGKQLGFGVGANFTKALLKKVKALLGKLKPPLAARRALDDAVDRLVNFTTNWQSGLLFTALVSAIVPDALPASSVSLARLPGDALQSAFDVAHQVLGIPQLISPSQIMSQPEEITIALYVAMIVHAGLNSETRSLKSQIATLQKELTEARSMAARVSGLEADLKEARDAMEQASGLNTANEDLNMELYEKSDEVAELKIMLQKLTSNNHALKRSLEETKAELARTKQSVGDPSLGPVVARMQSDIETLMDKDVSSRMLNLQAELEKTTIRLARIELQHRMHEKGVTISRTSEDNVPPPQGRVVLLATRVQGANRLWIKHPSVMARALNTHHAFLRTVLPTYGGYEIRVDGDSFLVAFASPVQALRCVFFLQTELMKRDWPREIVEAEDDDIRVEYASSGSTLFRGLRVSMGLHIGLAQTLEDPVSNRVDYQGDAVDLARALGAHAIGGQVLISEELHDAVVDALPSLALGTEPPMVEPLSPVAAGIGSDAVVTPYQIAPASLVDRSFAQAKRVVAEDVVELYKTRNLDAIQAALNDLAASSALLHTDVDELANDFSNRIQRCVSLQHRMKELATSVADPVKVRLALDKSIQVLHSVPSALNPEVSALAQAKKKLHAHSAKVSILEEVVTSLVEGQRNRWKGTSHARFASSFLDSKRESLEFAEEKKELLASINILQVKLEKARRALRISRRNGGGGGPSTDGGGDEERGGDLTPRGSSSRLSPHNGFYANDAEDGSSNSSTGAQPGNGVGSSRSRQSRSKSPGERKHQRRISDGRRSPSGYGPSSVPLRHRPDGKSAATRGGGRKDSSARHKDWKKSKKKKKKQKQKEKGGHGHGIGFGTGHIHGSGKDKHKHKHGGGSSRSRGKDHRDRDRERERERDRDRRSPRGDRGHRGDGDREGSSVFGGGMEELRATSPNMGGGGGGGGGGGDDGGGGGEGEGGMGERRGSFSSRSPTGPRRRFVPRKNSPLAQTSGGRRRESMPPSPPLSTSHGSMSKRGGTRSSGPSGGGSSELPALSPSGRLGAGASFDSPRHETVLVEEIIELGSSSGGGGVQSGDEGGEGQVEEGGGVESSLSRAEMGSMSSLAESGSSAHAMKRTRVIPEVPRLLLVEPNQVSQIMGKVVLEQNGYEVTAIGDGEGAVAEFEAKAGKPGEYHLVLTVVDVPGLDGFEICSALRRFEAERSLVRTPVVVMCNDMPTFYPSCLEAGVDGMFPSPISMSTNLVSTIIRYPRDSAPEKETLAAPGSVAIAHVIKRSGQ